MARPEGTSSGSSLSLTPAPAGLNECGPLFSSSNSHGSEEELETADLSAFQLSRPQMTTRA